jgi:hypothetical protein
MAPTFKPMRQCLDCTCISCMFLLKRGGWGKTSKSGREQKSAVQAVLSFGRILISNRRERTRPTSRIVYFNTMARLFCALAASHFWRLDTYSLKIGISLLLALRCLRRFPSPSSSSSSTDFALQRVVGHGRHSAAAHSTALGPDGTGKLNFPEGAGSAEVAMVKKAE